MALNVLKLLGDLPEAQHGYFTRAQAVASGVEDFELTRSVDRGFLKRLDHGVYRVAGAGYDPHQDLRVAWLRLDPVAGPRDRVRHPRIWVSHESAAALHGFGVYLAETPSFIAMDRLQPGRGVKVHRRSKGLQRDEQAIVDGFAVTTVARTAADLARSNTDGGHLGRFIDEALRANAVTSGEVADAMGVSMAELEAMISMDTSPVER